MDSQEEVTNFNALWQAFIMIVVSEIGDKTFLIAAILASRQPRMTVFAGAFASLVIMSILSAAMGRVIGLVPKEWTQFAAAVLFLVFGVRMAHEGVTMSATDSSDKMAEEIREVEEELSSSPASSIPLNDMEEGRSFPRSGSASASRSGSMEGGIAGYAEKAKQMLGVMASPVFAQAFVLTFLGEWGDRSQIATIALAAAHNLYVIAFGTILGHGLCTAGAVIGGRWLSTKISVKYITLIGAFLFLLFSILYFREAYGSAYATPSPASSFVRSSLRR
ncbi:Predicted membrane protein [Phaffia rhodozyma]|uniref:GDT1 family protein n=1 Tax=Phaffia rhodozyma TaxID=264483 RepID=A0A0F7SKH8_PHARH|nr:Predicted membrane protein [Phaffia rhodozyma]